MMRCLTILTSITSFFFLEGLSSSSRPSEGSIQGLSSIEGAAGAPEGGGYRSRNQFSDSRVQSSSIDKTRRSRA